MEKVHFYDKRQHFASLLLGRVSVCLGAPGGNSHKRDKCEAGVRGGGGGGEWDAGEGGLLELPCPIKSLGGVKIWSAGSHRGGIGTGDPSWPRR